MSKSATKSSKSATKTATKASKSVSPAAMQARIRKARELALQHAAHQLHRSDFSAQGVDRHDFADVHISVLAEIIERAFEAGVKAGR